MENICTSPQLPFWQKHTATNIWQRSTTNFHITIGTGTKAIPPRRTAKPSAVMAAQFSTERAFVFSRFDFGMETVENPSINNSKLILDKCLSLLPLQYGKNRWQIYPAFAFHLFFGLRKKA